MLVTRRWFAPCPVGPVGRPLSQVKAQWFNDVAFDEDEDFDPFEVQERGLPIEIGNEEARVAKSIQKSLEKEGRLDEQGITCAIKDRPDTTCWACPVFTSDSNNPLSVLCRLGREQDRLVTRAAQLQEERKEKESSGQDQVQVPHPQV